MQAVLCDVCERRVLGDAYELHVINGFAVRTETGTRIAQRRGSHQMYLCGPCGVWLQRALAHLREGHRALREAEGLLHPSLQAAG